MAYARDDLDIIDDAVALIRRHPDVYAGEAPRAARLAAKMTGDLLQFGARSVSAEMFGSWWVVTSQSDWLTINGVYHADYWHRIVAAPEIGLEAMRPEVLLTAFSRVLITVARESMEFIVGNEIGNAALQMRLRALLVPEFRGRAVGFLIEE
ncbi:MAG TPA: hypothetical protein VGL95_08650 [Acetobacteraceae bacterium]